MASSLRGPMTTSVLSSPSLPAMGSWSLKTLVSSNSSSDSKMPMPHVNPKDPFLSKFGSVAITSLKNLFNRPSKPDMRPYLDLFDSLKLMASPTQGKISVSYNEQRLRRPPPDLPSLLLRGRKSILICRFLVPAVSELVIAELMYLQWMDPKEPIYLYINSTGTTHNDGEAVWRETDGFAIYDAMMQLKNEIHTVADGAVISQACLLLTAGTKGKRIMMPHAKAIIQQPHVPLSKLRSAGDVLFHAKQAMINRCTIVELLAKHTGNSVETVSNMMKRASFMDFTRAKEFGVIDKANNIMAETASPEEWDNNAGIRVLKAN
ncbi:Endopeptidase Clp [Bertholletia excelsa]